MIIYVDHMNPLFPCDHGAATHSCIICMTLQDVGYRLTIPRFSHSQVPPLEGITVT